MSKAFEPPKQSSQIFPFLTDMGFHHLYLLSSYAFDATRIIHLVL